jgi:BioD-like phosphotransacetylase family protein
LVKEVYGLQCDLADMSPVAIPRGFTESYIDKPDKENLENQVKSAFNTVSSSSSFVIVEGTGHAGVGSVFDMSNGTVASMLKCKAIIVSSGGIGKPIDEIMLNKAMFDAAGVKILGAIINKVEDEKYDKVKSHVIRGLERLGVDVLGVMPYRPMLTNPTVGQLHEDIKGKILTGEQYLKNNVSKMIIGAMMPNQALEYLKTGTLLITPGTRDDLILAAMSSCILGPSQALGIAGIILTGGTPPHPSILELLKQTQIPVILVEDDTFTVASKIAKLIVKIRPSDTEKIRFAEQMVENYVDVDQIMEKTGNLK